MREARANTDDYASARAVFRIAAVAAGARVEALEIGARGPGDEPLTIDVAWLGAQRPRCALLVISGTHGVEGHAGSAVQTAFLESRPCPRPDEAVVLVHALNPWGYAHGRRVNERNVDLNRNFLGGAEDYAGVHPTYRALDPLLNPPSPPGRDAFWLRAAALIARHGLGPLSQAIAEGQYEYPRGLFYGGSEMEEGPRRFCAWIAERLQGVGELLVIDLHAGIGRRGALSLFAAVPELRGERAERLSALLQAHVHVASGVGYATRGDVGGGVARCLPGSAVAAITAEFGTTPPVRILYRMREENRWFHHGDRTRDHPARRGLLEAFAPPSPRWRAAVVGAGTGLLRRCAAVLGAGPAR